MLRTKIPFSLLLQRLVVDLLTTEQFCLMARVTQTARQFHHAGYCKCHYVVS